MPRCEGLPNLPCPGNRNDTGVVLGEGDLMLCASCDAERRQFQVDHPECAASTLRKVTTRSNSSSLNNGKVTVTSISAVDSDGKGKGNSRNSKKKNSSVSSNTDPTRDHLQRTNSDVDDTDILCPCCNDCIPDQSDNIRCDGCMQTYHQECTGLHKDVFITLKSIIKHTGWVCQSCRSQLNSVQLALTKTSEELADIRVSLAHLFDEIDTLKANTTVHPHYNANAKSQTTSLPTQSSTATGNIAVPKDKTRVSDLQLEIHRTVNEMVKRKSNVIITGLPESQGCSVDEQKVADEKAFTKLCEENLSLKPAILHNGCIRLGKADTHRPRKLLIRLHSEASASNLLVAAKELRKSDDDLIARNVFINPDLSPAAAKLAYEQRQRRRAAAAQRQSQSVLASGGTTSTTTTTASSFPSNTFE